MQCNELTARPRYTEVKLAITISSNVIAAAPIVSKYRRLHPGYKCTNITYQIVDASDLCPQQGTKKRHLISFVSGRHLKTGISFRRHCLPFSPPSIIHCPFLIPLDQMSQLVSRVQQSTNDCIVYYPQMCCKPPAIFLLNASTDQTK